MVVILGDSSSPKSGWKKKIQKWISKLIDIHSARTDVERAPPNESRQIIEHCHKIRKWKETIQRLRQSRETTRNWRMDSIKVLWSQWTQHSLQVQLVKLFKKMPNTGLIYCANIMYNHPIFLNFSWRCLAGQSVTPPNGKSHVVWTLLSQMSLLVWTPNTPAFTRRN